MTAIQVSTIKTFGTLAALVVSLCTTAFVIFQKSELTFDSQEQKHNVIQLVGKKENISIIDASHAIEHLRDDDVHMTFEEKARIIRIEENQKAIGKDLMEIKNLLRKLN